MDRAELHNVVAPAALKALCGPIIAGGGTGGDVLIALESVVAGAFLMAVNLGGDNIVFDVMVDRLRERLAEDRLGDLVPAGKA